MKNKNNSSSPILINYSLLRFLTFTIFTFSLINLLTSQW